MTTEVTAAASAPMSGTTVALPEPVPTIPTGAGPAKRRSAGAEQPPDAAAVSAAAEQLESFMKSNARMLEFRVDAESGRTVVSVRDPESGELIRQIPGEEVLRLARILSDEPGTLIDLFV